MNFLQFLLVFFGGGLGSCCRYLVSRVIATELETPFSLGTFTVNIVGCFLIGIIISLVERFQFHPYWSLLFATGFCGGFTTFSTFSYENNLYLKNDNYWLAFVYIFMSIVWGLAATFLGMYFIKKI
jgi:CrcB protein